MRVNQVIRPFSSRTKIWLAAGLVGVAAGLIPLIGGSGIIKSFGFGSPSAAVFSFGEADQRHYRYAGAAGGGAALLHSSALCHQAGRPYLGVTYLPITEVVARFRDLGVANGALITAVERNSPAEKAGLRPNDVIVEFDGVPLTADATLVALQMQKIAGDRVMLLVLRQQEIRQIDVTLAEMDSR